MMTISLSDVSKRFNRDWIFRKFTHTFYLKHSYAIIGPNGSGKSTLLQVIGGAIAMSHGEIAYSREPEVGSRKSEVGSKSSDDKTGMGPIQNSTFNIQNRIPADEAYKYISLAAPYLEVVEEMTAIEFLKFHQKFKPLLPSISIQEILSIVGLVQTTNKQIRYFSSGMKQRIKLAQAIFSDTPVVLLDEPCTNLDQEGMQLYQGLINDYCANRMVIVSSNDIQEYGFCEEKISIMDYK